MNLLPCNNFRLNDFVGLTLSVFCLGFEILVPPAVYPENDSRKGYSSSALKIQNRRISNMFLRMSPDKTGVRFVGQVDEWKAFQDRVLYNDAGVAVGDYDRDGFEDLFSK